MTLYTLIPKLIFLGIIIVIIYLIVQRRKEKKNEDFEDRNY